MIDFKIIIVAISICLLLILVRRTFAKSIRYNPDSEGRSGRTRRTYGNFGRHIGSITAGLIRPPYRAFTTENDVEIDASQLASEVFGGSKPWGDLKSRFDALTSKQVEGPAAAENSSQGCLVTLLVDHSGSMRGQTLEDTAAAIDQASRLLDLSQIPFEVIGYTTRSWTGGNSRKTWQAAGKPKNPGRLCDLMYINYKTFSQDYATARPSMAMLIFDDIRRENLDGEAILWAYHRFQSSGFKTWLCVVISDGAPVDDSTLMENEKTILDKHVRNVIATLASEENVTISGLGVNHDVSRYYPNAIAVKNTKLLAFELMKHIERQLAQA